MAEATDAIVYLTRWQIYLGAAGAAMLFYTLVLTRASVRAADRAVETTQRLGQAEIRAYISVEFGQLNIRPGEKSSLDFTIINNGSTPAYRMHYLAGLFIEEFPLLENERLHSPRRGTGNP